MRGLLRTLLFVSGVIAPAHAPAQQQEPPNGLLLIAKPTVLDPNFRRTVVLVTQAPDASTVGVIVNRPMKLRLSQLLSDEFATENYRDPVFFGGPVMRQALVAVFRSDATPAAPAFHVLKSLYLTMHPDNIKELLADPGRRYRIYAGFSGWAPHQLQGEFGRDDWYVLPAEEEILFRKDTEGLWEEMLRKATRARPQTRQNESPALGGALCPEPPGGAARAALVGLWLDATFGARRDATSFSAAHEFTRYPDSRPESRSTRLGNPAAVACSV
ncbi:MAG: YqgE/AlgH family protein [Burkholderiales bacterium]